MTAQSHACRRSRPRRRSQRGAAMVEAAMMFPLLIILFFSNMYAHSYSATKIDEATQARELAWTNAMTNCGASAGSTEKETLPDTVTSLSLTKHTFTSDTSNTDIAMKTTSNPLDPMNGTTNTTITGATGALAGGAIEGAFSGIVGQVLVLVAQIFPDPKGAQGIGKGSVSWRMPNGYKGDDPSNSTALTQTVTVTCNEKAQNGSVAAVVETLFTSIASFVEKAVD